MWDADLGGGVIVVELAKAVSGTGSDDCDS